MATADRAATSVAQPGRDDNAPPKQGTFLRQSSITLLSKAVIFVVMLLSGVIIARMLGPEQKGVYTLAVALPQIVARVAVLGIS